MSSADDLGRLSRPTCVAARSAASQTRPPTTQGRTDSPLRSACSVPAPSTASRAPKERPSTLTAARRPSFPSHWPVTRSGRAMSTVPIATRPALTWVRRARGFTPRKVTATRAAGKLGAGRRRQSCGVGVRQQRRGAQLTLHLSLRNDHHRFHDAWVELRGRAALQLLERRACGARLAVRAVGRHGAEGVAARDDPRLERYLLAEEAVGVATAVEAL